MSKKKEVSTDAQSMADEINAVIKKHIKQEESVPMVILFAEGVFPDQHISYCANMSAKDANAMMLEVLENIGQ